MSWQEELEQLDAQLADGRIGEQEHRRRAEDLLAGASGPTPSARTWRSQSPKQFAERDTQRLRPPWERGPALTQPEPPGQNSAQAEPEQQPQQQQQPAEQNTQPDRPTAAARAERPAQRRRPGQDRYPAQDQEQAPQHPGTAESQRAAHRHSPAAPRTAEPTWPPVTQPAPWQKAANYSQPPGNGQSGPAHPNPADRYLAAQQQSSGRSEPRSARNLLFAVFGGGLVLLIVVALVVWLLAFRTGNERAGAAQPQQPPATSSMVRTGATGAAKVPHALANRLPELPGDPVHAKDKRPIDSIVDDGYYSERIAGAISKAGPKSMLVRQSVRDGAELYLLAVIPTTSSRNCQAGAAAINDFQRDTGLSDTEQDPFGANTSMLTRTDKHGVYYRTVYCSTRMTVITAAASAHRRSADALRKHFTRFGESVQKTLPPN